MGRRLLINGVDRWEECVERNLNIEAQLTYKIDTCKFKLRGDQPHEGDEIIVEDDMVGRLFAGIVVKVSLYERTPDGSTSIWDVDSGDYTVQIDRKLVVETYENTSADVIFKDIVTKYCSEFTVNGVRSGAPSIEKIIFNYVKPSECFKQLCDYIGWQWDVSYYKDLSFFSTNDLVSPAPMKLTPGGQFYNLKHSIDQTTIKNRIYVLGGTMLSDPWTYETKADGTARTWVLPHEPSELTVSVGGVQKTVGQENIDKEEDFDFLYNKQEKYVKCSAQTPTPAAGTTISFTYKYPIPVITEVDDEESQQKIAAIQGGDGVYEDQITDDSLITIEAAEAAGNAQLREYANPKVTGSFQSEFPGWFPGQLVEINLPDRKIQDTFLIHKVTITPYTPEHWTYKVEYGGRLKGIDSFLQALVSAQQKKKLNDTNFINKVKVLKDTATITDEIISTPRTPPWVVEQSLELDILTNIVYDDFSFDLSKWNIESGATASIVSGQLKITCPAGASQGVLSKQMFYGDGWIQADIKPVSGEIWIEMTNKVGTSFRGGFSGGRVYLQGMGVNTSTPYSVSTGTYYTVKIEKTSGTIKVYVNNVLQLSGTVNTSLDNWVVRLYEWRGDSSSETWFDNVIVNADCYEFDSIGSLLNVWQTDSGPWPQPQYQISTDGGQTWGNWIAVDPAQRGYIEVPHPCRVRVKANGPIKVRNWKKPWGETDTVCGFVVCA